MTEGYAVYRATLGTSAIQARCKCLTPCRHHGPRAIQEPRDEFDGLVGQSRCSDRDVTILVALDDHGISPLMRGVMPLDLDVLTAELIGAINLSELRSNCIDNPDPGHLLDGEWRSR